MYIYIYIHIYIYIYTYIHMYLWLTFRAVVTSPNYVADFNRIC